MGSGEVGRFQGEENLLAAGAMVMQLLNGTTVMLDQE